MIRRGGRVPPCSGDGYAHDLQKRGRQVVPVDRDAPGNGVSFGNMASITVIEFMPASRPSVRWQIPGWMLDAEGPVRVRAHCAGEIGRVITGGVLEIPGKTMAEKLHHLNRVDDGLRRWLCSEPRSAPAGSFCRWCLPAIRRRMRA